MGSLTTQENITVVMLPVSGWRELKLEPHFVVVLGDLCSSKTDLTYHFSNIALVFSPKIKDE